MSWTFVLYGDTGEGTRRTLDFLCGQNVDFTFSLDHTVTTVPTLSTPIGPIRGYERIRHFVLADREVLQSQSF